ncbi:IS3 family transposase [Streptomyces coelicoflavus]|uniref:IS3 family transposase n=1 Tax=Streptomyces coelicoflavus TaxID=285562 RepID=UPI003AF31CA0
MIIKTEYIRGRVFATRAEANLALFEYIDGFYNSRRIQKQLETTSVRSSSRRSTTPTRQRPHERT